MKPISGSKQVSLQTVLCLLIFLFQPVQAQTTALTIESYDFNIIMAYPKVLNIELSMKLQANEEAELITFIFSSEAAIKSFEMLKNNVSIPVSYIYKETDTLIVSSEDNFNKSDEYEMRINYTFTFNNFNDTVVCIDRGNRWYPLIMDQLVPFRIKCTVPLPYSVISAGNLSGEYRDNGSSVYVWESHLPVFKLPLIIYNPGLFRKTSSGIIDLYSNTIDNESADIITGEVGKAFDYYNRTIGPYGFIKLTIFEINDFTGINTCSGLIIGGSQPLAAFLKGYDMLLLTVAQQWFGAGVFSQYGRNGFFFISLSLPHYLRLMYIREYKGEEAFRKALTYPLQEYIKFADTETDAPLMNIVIPDTREKSVTIYAKGPYVLSLLEEATDRFIWLTILRKMYADFYGKAMTLTDFKNYLRTNDTDEKSVDLFKKLMAGKGLPEGRSD